MFSTLRSERRVALGQIVTTSANGPSFVGMATQVQEADVSRKSLSAYVERTEVPVEHACSA